MEEDDADEGAHVLPQLARVPLMLRACKGHSVRIIDPKRMCIRCEWSARYSHEAIVVPLDDAAMRRSMTGRREAPRNDLQGSCQY
eukprot:6001774-Pyramimonas_sp.AAC.1